MAGLGAQHIGSPLVEFGSGTLSVRLQRKGKQQDNGCREAGQLDDCFHRVWFQVGLSWGRILACCRSRDKAPAPATLSFSLYPTISIRTIGRGSTDGRPM
jgi:hypothetical protein